MLRRTFLSQALAGVGLLALQPAIAASASASGILIQNVTRLYAVEVARAVSKWPGKIAVGGGRYSMGGQVAVRMGLHLDMRRMNKLVTLDPAKRVAQVQAG